MNNQTSLSPKNMFCNVKGSNKINREPKIINTKYVL